MIVTYTDSVTQGGAEMNFTIRAKAVEHHEPKSWVSPESYDLKIQELLTIKVSVYWTQHYWSWYLYPYLKSRWAQGRSVQFTLDKGSEIERWLQAWGIDDIYTFKYEWEPVHVCG